MNHKLLSLALLGIVVPVGLLATFRLTGILQGPTTISETITLEAVKWEFTRPNQWVPINKSLEASYADDGISSAHGIVVADYIENVGAIHYDDVRMTLTMNVTVTNPNGFVEGVYVVFRNDSQPSTVNWIETELHLENLSLVDASGGWTIEGRHKQAYVRLAGVNRTSSIYFRAIVEWGLLTPNNRSHQMEVIYEFTYYNGTAYNKIVQPFQLRMVGE